MTALVPPWNRIDAAVAEQLANLGLTGLSSYSPRATETPFPGLAQVNCHCDIMRWKPTRGFLGEEETLTLLAAHLRQRRLGEVDPAEPSGILTHHLVHDDAAWTFLDRLLGYLQDSDKTRVLTPRDVFGPTALTKKSPGSGGGARP